MARLTFEINTKNLQTSARELVGFKDLMIEIIFREVLGGGRRRPKVWRLGFGDEDGIDKDEMGVREKGWMILVRVLVCCDNQEHKDDFCSQKKVNLNGVEVGR